VDAQLLAAALDRTLNRRLELLEKDKNIARTSPERENRAEKEAALHVNRAERADRDVVSDVLLAGAFERDLRADDGDEHSDLVLLRVDFVRTPAVVSAATTCQQTLSGEHASSCESVPSVLDVRGGGARDHISARLKQQRDAIGKAEDVDAIRDLFTQHVSILGSSQASRPKDNFTSEPPSDTAASTTNGWPSKLEGLSVYVATNLGESSWTQKDCCMSRASQNVSTHCKVFGDRYLHNSEAQVVLAGRTQAPRVWRRELANVLKYLQHLRHLVVGQVQARVRLQALSVITNNKKHCEQA
jgi:hypothetical protein